MLDSDGYIKRILILRILMIEVRIIESVNVLIVMLLVFLIMQRRDVVTLLLVLFVYGTLHFSFGAIALIAKDSGSLLTTLHNEGGGMLAKLSALSLLGVIFVLLSLQAFAAWVSKPWCERIAEIHILVLMAAVLCGYIYNIRYNDSLQLKNVISIEAMLSFVLIGLLGSNGLQSANFEKVYSFAFGGGLILGILDCIAIYEVYNHHSWAVFLQSSGDIVYRASSTLFNPNLLGFWASLVYIGCAYLMYVYKNNRKIMVWGMILVSIAIYLSGSRSSGYLLLGILFISGLLIKDRLRWVPLIVLLLTMSTIYVVTAWIVPPFISSSEGWYEIALLGERFITTPLYLLNYFLMVFNISDVLPSGVPSEIVLSIEGRFVGEARDAGWLVLYQDVGWLGLVAVIFACCMLIAQGIRVYIAHPSPSSVYALAFLCYCLLMGFVMRFQIFPVWLFIGIVLILCLAFWRRMLSHASHIKVRECAF